MTHNTVSKGDIEHILFDDDDFHDPGHIGDKLDRSSARSTEGMSITHPKPKTPRSRQRHWSAPENPYQNPNLAC